ncbi:molybdopterin-dependent oxidoreductase [Ideonella sp. YS5]|uniref:molybdopterin-dependent oxidoreductase n=1 Tax=Ideonella sp. YS5 TaxID=3453714 RepID=UPI003EEB05F2
MTAAPPTRRSFLAGLAGLASWSGNAIAAAARPLAAPRHAVVLSITGQVARTNGAGRADFDMDMLAALPQRQVVTHTPWHQGEQTFTGPLLRDVLAEAGASGRTLVAVALNDYRCEIPVEDAQQFDVIVARLHGGEPMRVRDKGPLFVVYPFDSDARLRSERYYARSAWQLRSLIVQP